MMVAFKNQFWFFAKIKMVGEITFPSFLSKSKIVNQMENHGKPGLPKIAHFSEIPKSLSNTAYYLLS